MIVPGMFVCSSFLISVCMFIVSKPLLISSATVIVRAGGAICYACAMVLYNVCSVVLCTRVVNVLYIIIWRIVLRHIRVVTRFYDIPGSGQLYGIPGSIFG